MLLKLGRFDEAEAKLKEALLLDKNIESAYLDLSIVYASRNDRQRMNEVLTQYLNTLQPGSAKAELLRKRIEELSQPE